MAAAKPSSRKFVRVFCARATVATRATLRSHGHGYTLLFRKNTLTPVARVATLPSRCKGRKGARRRVDPLNLLPVTGYRASTLQGREGKGGNVSSLSWPLSNRKSLTATSRPASTRSHFLAAPSDAIAAFLSGVPGAHRVRPNLRGNVVAVDALPGRDLTALLAVRVICDVRVRAKALLLNTCTGTLFDVDPTFDGATIFEGLESSVPVVAEVLLFRRRRAVRPRLPRPLLCGRCGLFGHVTVTCSREHRCLQCAGRHPTNSCTVDRHRCLHCGGPHAATEPRCPQGQLERKVAASLASSKPRITRKQALELARSSASAATDSSEQRPAGQRATTTRPLSAHRQPRLSSAAITGGPRADSSISRGAGEPHATDNNTVQPPGVTAPATSVLVVTALASALRSLLELAPADSPARHMCVAAMAMHDALVQHG
ncbi:hypothetical protein HPB49_005655 [Dermacentor silvarum]|uniref:Uncharacterized protein n=1 Tax=Dermacentor silvarum TaxID=543639 RepID=A0ACB8CQB0_DERSI|nr:hypothetical protein HPB49_005655 [Dermacentor silvarum]